MRLTSNSFINSCLRSLHYRLFSGGLNPKEILSQPTLSIDLAPWVLSILGQTGYIVSIGGWQRVNEIFRVRQQSTQGVSNVSWEYGTDMSDCLEVQDHLLKALHMSSRHQTWEPSYWWHATIYFPKWQNIKKIQFVLYACIGYGMVDLLAQLPFDLTKPDIFGI